MQAALCRRPLSPAAPRGCQAPWRPYVSRLPGHLGPAVLPREQNPVFTYRGSGPGLPSGVDGDELRGLWLRVLFRSLCVPIPCLAGGRRRRRKATPHVLGSRAGPLGCTLGWQRGGGGGGQEPRLPSRAARGQPGATSGWQASNGSRWPSSSAYCLAPVSCTGGQDEHLHRMARWSGTRGTSPGHSAV